MAGRPRTRLAEALVAQALELLRTLEHPVSVEQLHELLEGGATSQLELDAATIAMRRLKRHPLIVVGDDGLLAHRVLTNGNGSHA